jgi:hypothetical protein
MLKVLRQLYSIEAAGTIVAILGASILLSWRWHITRMLKATVVMTYTVGALYLYPLAVDCVGFSVVACIVMFCVALCLLGYFAAPLPKNVASGTTGKVVAKSTPSSSTLSSSSTTTEYSPSFAATTRSTAMSDANNEVRPVSLSRRKKSISTSSVHSSSNNSNDNNNDDDNNNNNNNNTQRGYSSSSSSNNDLTPSTPTKHSTSHRRNLSGSFYGALLWLTPQARRTDVGSRSYRNLSTSTSSKSAITSSSKNNNNNNNNNNNASKPNRSRGNVTSSTTSSMSTSSGDDTKSDEPSMNQATEVCVLVGISCGIVGFWEILPWFIMWSTIFGVLRYMVFRFIRSKPVQRFSTSKLKPISPYLFPSPISKVASLFLRGDRAIIRRAIQRLDSFITVLIIITLIATIVFSMFFFLVQLRNESHQLAKQVWAQRDKVADAWSNIAGEEFEKFYQTTGASIAQWFITGIEQQIRGMLFGFRWRRRRFEL